MSLFEYSSSDCEEFSGFSSDELKTYSRTETRGKKNKPSNKVASKVVIPTKSSDKKSSDKRLKSSDKPSTKTNKTVQSSDKQSSDSTLFDVTKLSYEDVDKLRQVLGLVPPAEEHIDIASEPNLKISIDSSEILDNDGSNINYHSELDYNDNMSDLDQQVDVNKSLCDALFDEGNSIIHNEWELPKLKAPIKGRAISDSLAKLVNVACSSQCETSEFFEQYKVPENTELLCPPTVNQEIWKTLDKRAHQQDKSLVDIQNLVSVGMVPILQLAELLKTEIAHKPQAKKLLSDSLTIMAQVQYNLSIRRRYFIRPCLKKKYYGICNMSTPVSTKLFGDDINKEVKNCESSISLGKENVRPYFRGRGRYPRGNRYGNYQRYQPYPSQNTGNQVSRGSMRGRRPYRRAASATASATQSVAPNGE